MEFNRVVKKIAIVLPYRAHFGPKNAGAIEIGVCYQNQYSHYRDSVTVYGGPIDQPYKEIGYEVVLLGLNVLFGKNGGFARALKSHWGANIPDLIEVHNRVNVFLDLVKLFPDVPVTLHFHNDPLSIKGVKTPKQRRRVLDLAAHVNCCSSWARERFCSQLSGSFEGISDVVNGVPRPWSSFPQKEKLILFPNRLIKEKGTVPFAKALVKVMPKHRDWQCKFVGRGDEDVIKELEDVIAPIQDQVEVVGPLPYEDVLHLFEKASIVAVPVLWEEPFGRTAAEALAAGAALIATEHGGLKDILQRAGVPISPDVDSMAGALSDLLGDPDYLKEEQEKSWDNFDFTDQASADLLDDVRRSIFEK